MSSTRMQMMNLRDRKSNLDQESDSLFNHQSKENNAFKLALPQEQTPVYEPSSSNGITFQSRTATRLLKGKFDRGSSQQHKFQSTANSQQPFEQIKNKLSQSKGFKPEQSNGFGTSITANFAPKNPISQPSNQGLKLFLPQQQDYTQPKQKKLTSLLKLTQPKQQPPIQKRILIQKKQQPIKEIQQNQLKNNPQPKQVTKQIVKKEIIQKIQEIPITQLKPQNNQLDQLIQNQNELVECPQGCGRKFNKKALESHAKACKLVFMSKRKQFNSQAKRFTSKEQSTLVKQIKQKQKKEVQTKLQKTGDAWKTKSQGFRAVIKAIKQQNIGGDGIQQKQIGAVTCQYCQKVFSQILISKHIPICQVKKQKEKKQTKKTSKK